MINNKITFLLNRYTIVSRLYATDGTTLKKINHSQLYSTQNNPADGDKLQLFFICDGTETKLEITTRPRSGNGIFDIYINNVLDSSGYDDYSATTITKHTEVTLTQPIKKGLNTIEFRVNGKNAASSGYLCNIVGVSLQ